MDNRLKTLFESASNLTKQWGERTKQLQEKIQHLEKEHAKLGKEKLGISLMYAEMGHDYKKLKSLADELANCAEDLLSNAQDKEYYNRTKAAIDNYHKLNK